MSLEHELLAEQQYSAAWDREGYARVHINSTNPGLPPFVVTKPTTKACPECGDTKLVLLTSQNAKICSACKHEFVWTLDDKQKPVY